MVLPFELRGRSARPTPRESPEYILFRHNMATRRCQRWSDVCTRLQGCEVRVVLLFIVGIIEQLGRNRVSPVMDGAIC